MPSDAFGIDISHTVAILALAPFMGWGIYGLDRRYRRDAEWPPWVEVLTLVAVVALVAYELAQLREVMREQMLFYVFAVLGLFVSCVALYAHMAISLTSRLVVEFVVPGDDTATDHPRFGPAEMLERQKDYDGALQEYLVIARIYPHHPAVHLRVAENLLRLSRPEEATVWLTRALGYLTTGETCLPVVNRLCEVYQHTLKNPGQARATLESFLRRFPDSRHVEEVTAHLERLGAPEPQTRAAELIPLNDAPLESLEDAEVPARNEGRHDSVERM
jgi:tetratricopeptide (TPR) repeat protein